MSWFWFFGALFLAQFPGYTRDLLGGAETVVTVLLAAFSVGIGIGSMLCHRLSGDRVELGLVPIGSLGLTIFPIDFFFATPVAPPVGLSPGMFFSTWTYGRIFLDLVAIGISGGLYIVPLVAMIQERTESAIRSRVIAANNILNALLMVAAAVVGVALRQLGLTTIEILLASGLMNLLVAIYIFTVIPEFIMRFLIWMLMHSIYRLRCHNVGRIPSSGAALLVCNHVSYVDALILASASRRPIRFVVYHKIFALPVLNFIFKTARAIPIAPARESERIMNDAFDAVAEALESDELVCIFPEGKLTTTGELNPFKPGVERILKRTPAPVIPLALRGLWGSFFSHESGRAMSIPPWKWKIGARIDLHCGEPLDSTDANAAALQERVAALLRESIAR